MNYLSVEKRKSMVIIVMAVLLHYAGIFAGMWLPVATVPSFRHVTGTWLDHFLQWDALWYYAIAHFGYIMPLFAQQKFFSITNTIPLNPPLKAAAFFPGLPFVIQMIGTIPALLLGNVLFIFCVILLYNMVAREVNAKTAMVSVLLFAVNPASLYFTALYAEPYIVFCSMVILYAMQKETRRGDVIAFLLCMVVGFMYKMALFVGVFGLRYVRQGKVMKGILFMASACAGWVFFALYLWSKTSHPLAFIASESGWGREFSLPFVGFVRGLIHKDILDSFYFVLLLYLIVRYAMQVLKEDSAWLPKAPIHLFSLETGLFVVLDALVVTSSYVAYAPLMSVLRLLGVLWPIYITKKFTKQRYGKVWFGIFFVLFLIVTMIGAALYTHGYFYE